MAEKPVKTFGARLRTFRELQKISQTELADRAGLTPAAISQLETDDRLPAFNTLISIANALQTTVGALLGEQEGQMPPELKAFFRDLDALDSDDVAKVRGYAAYLRSLAKTRPK
jgi:transcriptional regulator with XRE-family HTH domain